MLQCRFNVLNIVVMEDEV